MDKRQGVAWLSTVTPQSIFGEWTTARSVRVLALFLGILMSGGSPFLPRIPMLGGILILCLISKGPWLGIQRAMSGIGLLLIIIFAVALIGGQGFHAEALATRYANFFAAILLLGIYATEPRDTLMKDLIPIGFLFSCQAILTVLLAEFANGLFIEIPNGENVPYHSIMFIFTYHVMQEDSTRFFRPDGFFFEPGVFQVYANLYLFLCLFVVRSRLQAALAFFAVMVIQSTTGIMIAIALVAIWYIRLLPTATWTEKLAGVFMAPLLAIPIILIGQGNIDDKFNGVGVGSKQAREYDFYTGMRIAQRYPLTGIGFDYERYYDLSAKYGYTETELPLRLITERPTSNGIVSMFWMLGFPLSFVLLWGFYRQRFFPYRLTIFLLMLVSLASESIALTPFFLLLMFSGLLVSQVRKKKPAAPLPAMSSLGPVSFPPRSRHDWRTPPVRPPHGDLPSS